MNSVLSIIILSGIACILLLVSIIIAKKITMLVGEYSQTQNNLIQATKEYSEIQAKIEATKICNAENIALDYSAKEQAAKLEYSQLLNNLKAQAEESKKSYHDEIKQKTEEYHTEYLNKIQECDDLLETHTIQVQSEIDQLNRTLLDYKSKVNALTELNRHKLEEEEQKNFFKLCLLQENLDDIKQIRSIEPALRNAEPLNKILWTVYYKTPTDDMCSRVIGPQKKTGIYKITNLIDGKIYVGQAVDIKTRWTQHIKRGIGAEAGTKNKLYTAMLSIGVENFSFEIVEECEQSQLNEREKYWIEFFNCMSFGYNMRNG